MGFVLSGVGFLFGLWSFLFSSLVHLPGVFSFIYLFIYVVDRQVGKTWWLLGMPTYVDV